MNRKKMGIWLSRRSAVAVGLSSDRGSIVLSLQSPRGPVEPAAEALKKLLSEIPSEWHSSDIGIALSPCFMACCDCFEVPFRSDREIETTAASIVESRCAGECAEELAIDIRRVVKTLGGSLIQAVAIRQVSLASIRSAVSTAWPHAKFRLVTGATAVWAQAISTLPDDGLHLLAISASREAHIVSKQKNCVVAWRSFSFDYATPDCRARLHAEAVELGVGSLITYSNQDIVLAGRLSLDPALAIAATVALVEPKDMLDLLKGAQDAPKSSIERLRKPLIAACVALILFSAAIGTYFHRQALSFERAIADAESVEQQCERDYLHGEKPEVDGLMSQMNKQLAEHLKRLNANHQPSVLAFWSEVAQALPNPERIGLVTDSLQLGHEEGRLIGRVSRGQDDALKNASLLETNLNRSGHLSTHGEFETKETEILVRLRMNFHPKSEAGQMITGAKP